MLRNVAAVIAALFVGNLTVIATEVLTHSLFPIEFDPNDEAAMRAAIATLPTLAFVILLAGWSLAAFLEGVVAAKISRTAPIACALIAGGIQTVGAAINVVTIPHPAWFYVSVLVFLPSAYLGARPFAKKQPAS